MKKICTKCGIEKDILEYYKRKDAKIGYKPQCKKCYNKATVERQKNNPKYIEYQKKYNKENYEIRLEKHRMYNEKNKKVINEKLKKHRKLFPEKIKENMDRYLSKNMNKVRARNRKYKKNNRDKANARTKKYRTMKINQYPSHAIEEIIKVFYFVSNGMTKIMGVQYNVDHIIPLAKGGLHSHENLQVLLATENFKKGDKLDYSYGS